MTTLRIAQILTLGLTTTLSSSAANFFFSFQNEPDGTGFGTTTVTALEGIETSSITPNVTLIGTEASTIGGGELSFVDFEGTTWLGSGTSSTSQGDTARWNSTSEGNSLVLNFDATGLEDMSIRMAIRSAGGSAPTSFDSLTYDIGGGAVAIGTIAGFAADSNFNEWTIDLSSVSEIEGQSDVTLTWNIQDIVSGSALRIDNIQLSAIPEPASFTLLASLPAFVFCVMGKRRVAK